MKIYKAKVVHQGWLGIGNFNFGPARPQGGFLP